MKQFGVSLFLFVLWLSLSAIAQDAGQQSSAGDQSSAAQTTTSQSTTQTTTTKHKHGARSHHLKGKISDDGTTLTDKDNKAWAIDNPDAVKGHEGHDVRLSGQVDAASNSIHVTAVKMAGERASKKKGGAMADQSPQ